MSTRVPHAILVTMAWSQGVGADLLGTLPRFVRCRGPKSTNKSGNSTSYFATRAQTSFLIKYMENEIIKSELEKYFQSMSKRKNEMDSGKRWQGWNSMCHMNSALSEIQRNNTHVPWSSMYPEVSLPFRYLIPVCVCERRL